MPSQAPPGSRALCASDILLEAPPCLEIGPNLTKSSALHDVHFTGKLAPWTTFIADVEDVYWANIGQAPRSGPPLHIIAGYQLPPYSLSHEQVIVGDETGVQGRFNQLVGQAVGGVFRCMGQNVCFGDFKSVVLVNAYSKVPDSVLRTWAGAPIAVGELKVPWISQHRISEMMLSEDRFRPLIGQIALYQRDLGLKYGYLSTFDETMFFKIEDAPGAHESVLKCFNKNN